jgi:hypothetical protein
MELADEIFDRYLAHQPDGSALERGPEDVKVVTRWTHRGEFRGIAPTGDELEITGIGIFRFSEGKVVESWDNFDQLGMMQQLGVVPTPEQSEEASPT